MTPDRFINKPNNPLAGLGFFLVALLIATGVFVFVVWIFANA